MNTSKQTKTALVLGAIFAIAPASSLTAEVILKENFDTLSLSHVGAGRYPHVVAWEGPSAREFGYVQITDQFPGSETATVGKDRLNVLAIHDTSAAPNKAPSLVFPWKDKAPSSGHLSISWDFLVSAQPPFYGINFLGNSWDGSAAGIILKDGNILLHANKGDSTRLNIGSYKTDTWHTLKAELDIAARTLDIWLDGKKVANAVPWLASAPVTIDRLSTVADFAPVERSGSAVLFIDDLEVSSK